jgi:hypothetical protein
LENKEKKPLDSQVGMRFSSVEEEKKCFIEIRGDLIKLLYLIEDEQKGQGDAELFLFGLLYEIASANTMSNNKLTKVLVKVHVLMDNNYQYKTMSHTQIKRQIMESRGILDHLIGEQPKKTNK